MKTGTSETVTRDIRVTARAFFLPEESTPTLARFVWGYRIAVTNHSSQRVQLLARHWVIIDAEGNREDVRGPGVVGQTPTLAPGQTFKYTSFCPLSTEWGTMEGSYQIQRENGESFDVKVNRFVLAAVRAAALV